MASNDVKIKVSLDGDKLVIDGLDGIGDAASESDSKLGKLAKGGLAGVGTAAAAMGVAAIAAGAAMSAAVISAYADYEQNLGGIETMFGATSARMVEYADQAYITTGLSANKYMEQVTSFSASLLQGLGGDTEAAATYANRAMVDMSDNANKFGTDIGAIQNAYQGFAKQNYTMLDNLKLGYGGTAAEMARLINDSGVLGDTMEVTAATVNDVSFDTIIESIHVMQTEMGIAGTTALEATQTISGSIGMLQGSFENLLTGLGSADADVATLAGNVIESLETVVNNVGPVISNIGSHMETLGPQLGGMIEGLVGVVVDAIPTLLQAGVGMIGGLISGVTSALPSLIAAAVPAIVGLVEMIASQLPLLIDAGMKALVALGQGIAQALPELIPVIVESITFMVQALIDNAPMLLEAALELILGLATGLIEALPALIERLPEIILSIIDFFISSIPMIIETGISLLMSLIEALPEIITGIVAAIPQIITGVVTAVLGSIPQLIQAGIQLFIALIDALPQIITEIVKAIPQIVTGIVGALIQAIPQLIEAGGELIMGLLDGIWQAVPRLLSSLGDVASSIVGAIGGFFGIASPSKVFRDEIGRWLPAGLGEGVTEHTEDAIEPVQDMGKQMLKAAQEIPTLTMNHAITSAGFTPQSSGTSTPYYTPTSTVSSGEQLAAAMALALSGLSFTPDVTATIDPSDMDALSSKVRSAIVSVRDADSQEAELSIQRGER